MAIDSQPTDRQGIHDELERVRADLHHFVASATAGDLRRRTNGTRWTNGQMLWHMAFGYVIVRRLLPPRRFQCHAARLGRERSPAMQRPIPYRS